MKQGSLVKLAEGIILQLGSSHWTTMELDPGIQGEIVSEIGPRGFCYVKFKIGEKVNVTTYVHIKGLKQLTKSDLIRRHL